MVEHLLWEQDVAGSNPVTLICPGCNRPDALTHIGGHMLLFTALLVASPGPFFSQPGQFRFERNHALAKYLDRGEGNAGKVACDM